VEATTPGNVDGEPAGGSEYLSAKLNELREGNKYSLTVAAGDLIGGSPATNRRWRPSTRWNSTSPVSATTSSTRV
jgi:5'-nucleotidase